VSYPCLADLPKNLEAGFNRQHQNWITEPYRRNARGEQSCLGSEVTAHLPFSIHNASGAASAKMSERYIDSSVLLSIPSPPILRLKARKVSSVWPIDSLTSSHYWYSSRTKQSINNFQDGEFN
jgi:hypothetical protein